MCDKNWYKFYIACLFSECGAEVSTKRYAPVTGRFGHAEASWVLGLKCLKSELSVLPQKAVTVSVRVSGSSAAGTGPTKHRTGHKFSIFCSRLTAPKPQFASTQFSLVFRFVAGADGVAGAVFRRTRSDTWRWEDVTLQN